LSEEIKKLTSKCRELLQSILKISKEIEKLSKDDKLTGVEKLYIERGDIINTLLEKEEFLNNNYGSGDNNQESHEIVDYMEYRDKNFKEIFSIDKITKNRLLEFRQNVMSELKQLHKGKKMQLGYLNNQKFNPGFIDFKE